LLQIYSHFLVLLQEFTRVIFVSAVSPLSSPAQTVALSGLFPLQLYVVPGVEEVVHLPQVLSQAVPLVEKVFPSPQEVTSREYPLGQVSVQLGVLGVEGVVHLPQVFSQAVPLVEKVSPSPQEVTLREYPLGQVSVHDAQV
jgi:hypothetical protein